MANRELTGSQAGQERLFEIIGSVVLLQCVRAVSELGVSERLSGGPQDVSVLAQQVGVSAPMLNRVMRLLSRNGIYEEVTPGCYQQSATSNLLQANVPGSMKGMMGINPFSGFMADTLSMLPEGMKRGEPPFSVAHDGTSLWHYFSETDPAAAAPFIVSAGTYASLFTDAIVAAIECDGVEKVADIGGNDGRLLQSLLGRYPGMSGILFDRPEVIDAVSEAVLNSDVGARCQLEKGSFLESAPADIDAYVMSHILHDWNDAACIGILSNCRKASPRAKVLIAERLIEPDGSTHPYTLVMDVWMLMLFPEAKERTLEEYKALLEAAGYRLAKMMRTESPFSIIEAVPA